MRLVGKRLAVVGVLLLVAVFRPTPASAVGVTYYIDSLAGSDANAGTSAAAPWKSLRMVGDATSPVSAGDTILLKRGSVWNDSIFVNDDSVTIDAYGTGARPKIDSSVPVTGWTLVGLNTYKSPQLTISDTFREGLGNVTENGVMMSLPDQLGSTGTVADLLLAPNGSYIHDTSNVIYIKTANNPNAAGMSYRASTLLFGVQAKGNGTVIRHDILVQNLDVTRVSQLGVEFYNCVRCSVKSSSFSNLGGWIQVPSPVIYAGNGVQWAGRSSQGVADGLTMTQIFDSGISPQVFDSNNVIDGIEIRNSTIDRAGYAGVEISTIGTPGQVNNVHISGLTITNMGRGWSGQRNANKGPAHSPLAHGVLISALTGSMTGNSIERTTITGSVGEGIRIEGETGLVKVDRVRSSGNSMGLEAFANQGTGSSLKLRATSSIFDGNATSGLRYDAATGAGLELYQNTFYKNTGKNLEILGQSNLADLRNNLFASESDIPQLFVANYPSEKYLKGAVTVDNNCYTQTSLLQLIEANYMIQEELQVAGTAYKAYKSLAGTSGYRAISGRETHGVEALPVVGLNPTGLALTNPNAGDFSLTTASPCIGIGTPIPGVTTDYLGNTFRTPPSAGAIERP